MLAGSLGLMGQAAFADRADAEENLHKLKLPEAFILMFMPKSKVRVKWP